MQDNKDRISLTRRAAVKLGMGGVLAFGATTLVPFTARAAGMGDEYETDSGKIAIHPVQHASFVMKAPGEGGETVIYNDPVGGAALQPLRLLVSAHQHHWGRAGLWLIQQGDCTQRRGCLVRRRFSRRFDLRSARSCRSVMRWMRIASGCASRQTSGRRDL